MADSEKLTALKKAYAEIILNTAKEAAARIMVSERKSHRYQQELFAAKDESLHMLVRLKQMLDAKVNEAEMMSLNQQKRIEELEAQLGEAEDIVRDLRAELREAQDELEKLTKNPMRCLGEQQSEHDVAAWETLLNGNTISNFQSVMSSQLGTQTDIVTVSDIKSSTNAGMKCSCKDNCYVCNPDFASIVMRRKEPDLYRNGCTQRIRALERCLLNENRNGDTREHEEEKHTHTKVSRPKENIGMFKVMQTDVHNIIQSLPESPFHRKRKRAPSLIDMHGQIAATCQESNLLCPENFSQSADENARLGEDSRIINHDASEGSRSPSIPTSPSIVMEVVTESGYEKVDKDDPEFVKACDLHNVIDDDKLLTDKKELTGLDSGSAENLGVVSCKLELEMVDVSSVNLDAKVSEVTEGSSPQPVNNKHLMYTFKRKRKKDSLSSPDRDCSIEDTSKNKMEDKRNGSLDSKKSTLTAESSRDSRRLAQVARQLISLSEKKWR